MNGIRPTMLIVEDEPGQAQCLVRAFEQPEAEWIVDNKLGAFDVTLARTGREAECLLEDAVLKGTSFDLILLDLSLPYEVGAGPNPEVGFRVLVRTKERKPRPCFAVVIASYFQDVALLRDAIRNGADDYVPKAQGLEETYRTCLSVCRRGIARAVAAVNYERSLDLFLNRGGAYVADFMARVVSDGVSEVLGLLEDLSRQCQDQCQLIGKAYEDETSYSTVDKLKRATSGMARECSKRRNKWVRRFADESADVCLEEAIDEAIRWLRPCLLDHGVIIERIESVTFIVRTFPEDLKWILREILFSRVEAIAETNLEHELGRRVLLCVVPNVAHGVVELRVEDSAESLPLEAREMLTAGIPIEPPNSWEKGRSGVWRSVGLGVVQQVAAGIGARLAIAASPTGRGNCIILRLPILK